MRKKNLNLLSSAMNMFYRNKSPKKSIKYFLEEHVLSLRGLHLANNLKKDTSKILSLIYIRHNTL